jgi:preprotein translocase subunit YajC
MDLFIQSLRSLPLLQAAQGGASGQLMTTFVTFGLVILIFYFLIIRPQNKKQKETRKMLEAVKKGDRVATIGGIRGTIQSVKDEVVVIKVDDHTKMEFSKSAISAVLDKTEQKPKGSSKKREQEQEQKEIAEEDEAQDREESETEG